MSLIQLPRRFHDEQSRPEAKKFHEKSPKDVKGRDLCDVEWTHIRHRGSTHMALEAEDAASAGLATFKTAFKISRWH
jgi:hypothetical protein